MEAWLIVWLRRRSWEEGEGKGEAVVEESVDGGGRGSGGGEEEGEEEQEGARCVLFRRLRWRDCSELSWAKFWLFISNIKFALCLLRLKKLKVEAPHPRSKQ